ncbi:MAG: insulinase family protein, partial [Chloroflexi bacterium]|nr:insulinase family protein [Chloroflexota bacterium]
RMYQDNPQDQVQIVFDEVMFPGHPLGRDVAGREETVRSFTADDCRAHLRRHVRPDALVVSIAGAVDPAAAKAMLLEELSPWVGEKSAASPPVPPPATPPDGEPMRLVRRAAEQANVLIGARAPSYLDPDRYAVDILNVVLGEGMSSRLFLELRERQGVVYDVHSFTSRLADTGVLGIGLGAEPRRMAGAAKAAVAELRRLAEEEVGDAELTKAREYAKGRLLLQLESTSALCEYAGQQQLLTGTIVEPEEVVSRLDAVDAGEVRRVAGRVLDAGLRAAAVGPFRSQARLAAALG